MIQEFIRERLTTKQKVKYLEAAGDLLYSTLGKKYKELDVWEWNTKQVPHILNILKIGDEFKVENQNIAFLCNEIGLINYHQGKFANAEYYYKKSLMIKENKFGSTHPSVANSYNNLGGLYQIIGMYQEAKLFYEKALSIADYYNNLVELYNCLHHFYGRGNMAKLKDLFDFEFIR